MTNNIYEVTIMHEKLTKKEYEEIKKAGFVDGGVPDSHIIFDREEDAIKYCEHFAERYVDVDFSGLANHNDFYFYEGIKWSYDTDCCSKYDDDCGCAKCINTFYSNI